MMLKKLKGKKKLLLVLLGLIIVSVFIFAFKSNGEKLPNVTVTTVQEGEIVSSVACDGIIKSKAKREISSELPHHITQILIREGDRVSKGDVLATLESSELEEQVKAAEIELEMEREELLQLKDGIKSGELHREFENAKLEYENFHAKYKNYQKLYREGAISKEKIDDLFVELKTLENKYYLAKEKLEDLDKQIQIQEKEVRLKELQLASKRRKLDESVIESPIEGTVVASNAEVGIPANSLSPLFVISDTENLLVEVEISEYDINRLELGQEAMITGDAFEGKEYKGRISYIAPAAVIRRTGSETETNVKVEIDLTSGDLTGLIPGLSADVSIKTAAEKNALLVPYETIYTKKDDSTVVFIVTDEGIIKEVPVRTGIEGDINLEIISSEIKPGTKLVLNPGQHLKDGMKVNILNKGEKK